MPGLEDWIEVFRTGTHTDGRGNTRTWTEADLDLIASSYDPATHEAPAVLGHPADNAPAWAWVEALKRNGSKLLAKFRQVAPAFQELVQQGRFKKRSIALYPDMKLRHVGFLGATPPAVKGLQDVAFADGEHTEVELDGGIESPTTKEDDMDEKIKAALDAQAAAHQKELEDLRAKIGALAQQTEQREKEFQESSAKTATELQAARAALAHAQAKERKAMHAQFCEGLKRDGKLLPAQMDRVVDLLMTLDGLGEMEFSDGKKHAPTAEFQELLKSLPVQITRGQMKDGATPDNNDVDDIIRRVQEYQKQCGRNMAFAEAVAHVTR